MLIFSQVRSKMTILAHLAKLTDQPTTLIGGTVFSAHTKFLPNRYKNGNFSPYSHIDQPKDQPLIIVQSLYQYHLGEIARQGFFAFSGH